MAAENGNCQHAFLCQCGLTLLASVLGSLFGSGSG